MIQITKKSDYAVVILSYFAQFADHPVLTAREVAAGTRLPAPTVAKILKGLVRKGLLRSLQGVKGGYQLSRSAEDISIAEVIEALEGPIAMTECTLGIPGACRSEDWCSVRPHWSTINVVIRTALGKLPLSLVMKGPEAFSKEALPVLDPKEHGDAS